MKSEFDLSPCRMTVLMDLTSSPAMTVPLHLCCSCAISRRKLPCQLVSVRVLCQRMYYICNHLTCIWESSRPNPTCVAWEDMSPADLRKEDNDGRRKLYYVFQ